MTVQMLSEAKMHELYALRGKLAEGQVDEVSALLDAYHLGRKIEHDCWERESAVEAEG